MTINSASEPAATKAQASDTLPVLRKRSDMAEFVSVCILSMSLGFIAKILQPMPLAKKINELWLTLSCGTATTKGLENLCLDLVFSKALLKLSKVALLRKPKPATIIFQYSIVLSDKRAAISSLNQLLWQLRYQNELNFHHIHLEHLVIWFQFPK